MCCRIPDEGVVGEIETVVDMAENDVESAPSNGSESRSVGCVIFSFGGAVFGRRAQYPTAQDATKPMFSNSQMIA